MLELSVQQPLVLGILQNAFLVRVKLEDVSHEVISSKQNETITALIRRFGNAETTQFFIFLDNLLNKASSWVRTFLRQEGHVEADSRHF